MRALVLVTAWPRYVERAQYLERSLASLREHVQGYGLAIDWCVATETLGCDEKAQELQDDALAAHGFRSIEHRGAPGLGDNLNNALTGRDYDYLLYTQEDWLATGPVPLANAALLLTEHPDIACARLLLSRHDHPQLSIPGASRWRELLPAAEWFFAHNPYVARRDFIEAMLPFPNREGQASTRAKKLVVEHDWRFAALTKPYPFRHIGKVPAMTEKHAARAAARKASP